MVQPNNGVLMEIVCHQAELTRQRVYPITF